MKTTIEMTLSLEHLHRDLADIPCEVKLDVYEGSNTTDDPAEIEVLSIYFLEDVKTDDMTIQLKKGGYIFLDNNLEKQIIKAYDRLQIK